MEPSLDEGSRMDIDRKDSVRRSIAQGVTAMRMPWPTVFFLLAGIFLILTYA
jgi:hypothetical protein